MRLSSGWTVFWGLAAVLATTALLLRGLSLVPRGHPHGLPGLMAMFGIALFLPGGIVAVLGGASLSYRVKASPEHNPFATEILAAVIWLGLGAVVATFGLSAYAMELAVSDDRLPIGWFGGAMVGGAAFAGLIVRIMMARARAGFAPNARRPAAYYMGFVALVLAVEVAIPGILILGSLFLGRL